MPYARRAAGALALVAMVPSPSASADDSIVEAPVCSSAAIAEAHRAASPAVVHVQAPNRHGMPELGLGFLFGATRWVATSLSLVENGRGIVVVQGEERRDAVLVAAARAEGLAILELDRPLTGDPLVATPSSLSVGDPLIALGLQGWGEEADVVVAPGIVTAAKGDHLRTDALDGLPLRLGALLLDCAGDLVGVATRRGGYVAFADELDGLAATLVPDAEPIESGWSLSHLSVAFVGQVGASNAAGLDHPDGWLGASLCTALIGDDRWFFPFEARATVLARSSEPLLERRGMRLQLGSGIGHRFMLSGGGLPLYLTPVLGAALSWEQITSRPSTLVASGCESGVCPVTVHTDERNESLIRVMPTAGLRLQAGPAFFGYELQLDVSNPKESVHTLMTGLQF